MLDALHEDVNRVIDKPYVPAPDEDDASSGRSDQELADSAWDRHVQRNRSVIVDLFQGQLKMECRCPVCNKKVFLALVMYYFLTSLRIRCIVFFPCILSVCIIFLFRANTMLEFPIDAAPKK